ncbi:MAG: hypothetical protein KDB02_16280 [Acidimicrobiales bacterium]|nr:hypothetical protein [Acidimicrobiales bacterium]
MDAPDTVTEALDLLAREGYEVEFQFHSGRLMCDQASCTVEDAEVERVMRFEGPSDPGDEMIVFGIRDPGTGIRGRFASAFGSSADPEILDHLVGLASRFSVEVDSEGRQVFRPR